MHALTQFPEIDAETHEQFAQEAEGWRLKGLKPLHKQVASLLAQGKKQVDVARLCGITKEYVWMLSRQPLVQSYMYEAVAVAGLQLEATFPLVVETIQDTLENGTEAGKLKAARLHLEATKRIGRTEIAIRPTEDALAALDKLADRLMALQGVAEGRRSGGASVVEGEFTEVASSETAGLSGSSAG